jgi:nicotinamide riboside kinase
MTKTKVINLFGAPHSGKSVAAAGLYYNLKVKKKHCEMVREYIKNWVWEGRKPNTFDQPYIFGKQLKYESMLYNKVDYVITDSPFILAAYYEKLYENVQIVQPAALEFLKHAQTKDVEYLNFWLPTVEEIDERGREWTDSSMIPRIANEMRRWLVEDIGLELIDVDCPLDERINFILSYVLPRSEAPDA